jgi:hypothetical protein
MMGISQPDVVYSDDAIPGEYDPVATAVPVFVGYTEKGTAYTLVAINSFDDYESAFGVAAPDGYILYYAVRHYFDNGGRGGFVLSLGPYANPVDLTPDDLIAAISDGRISTAIAQEASITLVAIPDMVLLPDGESAYWAQAWLSLLAACQVRAGVFGVFDSPDDPANAAACLSAFLAQHPTQPEWGAAYWPRLVTGYESDTKTQIVVPPSAAVIAVMATTDEQYGIWRAPANVALSQVIKPTCSWLQSSGLFQTTGPSINLIRSFAGKGVRIWGCRTLAVDIASPWLYVQIRRLVAHIESQIGQLGRHFVFEDNNALTWVKFHGMAHIWLRNMWLEGGLYGAEEAEAFFVQIGLGETMTQADIDQGKMIIKIGVAVAYPAEFIEISLTFDTRMSVNAPQARA